MQKFIFPVVLVLDVLTVLAERHVATAVSGVVCGGGGGMVGCWLSTGDCGVHGEVAAETRTRETLPADT